jgi:hypothetical protein
MEPEGSSNSDAVLKGMPRESYEQQGQALKKVLSREELSDQDLKHLENAARNLYRLAQLRAHIMKGELDADLMADEMIALLHLPRDVVKS